MKNFSRVGSIWKRLSLAKNASIASIGPGPNFGSAGWPLILESSTIR